MRKKLFAEEFILKQKQIDCRHGDIGIGQVEDGAEKVVAAVDQKRQPARHAVPLEEREIDASCQVEQTKVGEQMDIYRGLSRLKEAERTCITLFFMEDLPIEKIAIVTGMPAGTVKSHLSRGKEKLSNFLKQNGYDGK